MLDLVIHKTTNSMIFHPPLRIRNTLDPSCTVPLCATENQHPPTPPPRPQKNKNRNFQSQMKCSKGTSGHPVTVSPVRSQNDTSYSGLFNTKNKPLPLATQQNFNIVKQLNKRLGVIHPMSYGILIKRHWFFKFFTQAAEAA